VIDTLAMANALEAAGMERRQAEALTDHLNRGLRASVEHRLDRVDSRLETIEQRLVRIEAELAFHRWAFAIVIGLQIALLLRGFWPA
jgi:hypothetical protein